jgi:hypothetical protein
MPAQLLQLQYLNLTNSRVTFANSNNLTLQTNIAKKIQLEMFVFVALQ